MSDIIYDDLLAENGVELIFGEINTNTSEKIIKFLVANNLKKRQLKNLSLLINSSGGDLTDAFAIIDCMKQSKIPIHTQAFGQISSCALLIFMAGLKGERVIAPNTIVMSHQWSTEISGKYFELESYKVDFNLTKNRVINHYKIHTTLNEKEIMKKLLPQHDVFLTPDETLKYGLADRIM